METVLAFLNNVKYVLDQPIGPWWLYDLMKGIAFTSGALAFRHIWTYNRVSALGCLLYLFWCIVGRYGVPAEPLTILKGIFQLGVILSFSGMFLFVMGQQLEKRGKK